MHVAHHPPASPPAGAATGIVTDVSEMRRHLLDEGGDVAMLAGEKLCTNGGHERVKAQCRTIHSRARQGRRMAKRLRFPCVEGGQATAGNVLRRAPFAA